MSIVFFNFFQVFLTFLFSCKKCQTRYRKNACYMLIISCHRCTLSSNCKLRYFSASLAHLLTININDIYFFYINVTDEISSLIFIIDTPIKLATFPSHINQSASHNNNRVTKQASRKVCTPRRLDNIDIKNTGEFHNG